jgi:hypothetical protein
MRYDRFLFWMRRVCLDGGAERPLPTRRIIMRKLNVSTLVSLDGVSQDPGGFGETEQGGWANPYFTADAQREALEHLQASDYFLLGRVTYEVLHKAWGNI